VAAGLADAEDGDTMGKVKMSAAGLSTARLARLRQGMAAYVERRQVPGLVTLVSRRGEVHVEAIGSMAEDAVGEPMRRDTIFRIASMTKPVIAAAAMILVEEARLRLDDPVDPWLPELADRKVLRAIDAELDDTVPARRPITLRDLLTLRLGLGAVMAPPGRYPIQRAMAEAGVAPAHDPLALPQDELMKGFGSLPLLHQPGEKWAYQSGSDILGVLLARATGGELGAFLRERIFAPLGMKDTGFSVPPAKLARLAPCYRAASGSAGSPSTIRRAAAASRALPPSNPGPRGWSRPPTTSWPSGRCC